MANSELTKRTGDQQQRPIDIFGAMRNEMDRVFDRFETGWPQLPRMFGTWSTRDAMRPELDVRDDGQQITVEMDLPGIEEKDVAVTVANGMLTIKGERKSEREEKKDSYYLAERSHGAFERSIRLPDSIDEAKLEARFDKGVLTVIAPKRPDAVKAEKRIEIKKG